MKIQTSLRVDPYASKQNKMSARKKLPREGLKVRMFPQVPPLDPVTLHLLNDLDPDPKVRAKVRAKVRVRVKIGVKILVEVIVTIGPKGVGPEGEATAVTEGEETAVIGVAKGHALVIETGIVVETGIVGETSKSAVPGRDDLEDAMTIEEITKIEEFGACSLIWSLLTYNSNSLSKVRGVGQILH